METAEIEILGEKYPVNIIKQDEKYLMLIKSTSSSFQLLEKMHKYLSSKGWNNLTIIGQGESDEIIIEKVTNPLAEIVPMPDELYNRLREADLFNPTQLRNLIIRDRYKKLRAQKIKAGEAVEIILKDYPHLTYDTIRKITVHNPKHKEA